MNVFHQDESQEMRNEWLLMFVVGENVLLQTFLRLLHQWSMWILKWLCDVWHEMKEKHWNYSFLLLGCHKFHVCFMIWCYCLQPCSCSILVGNMFVCGGGSLSTVVYHILGCRSTGQVISPTYRVWSNKKNFISLALPGIALQNGIMAWHTILFTLFVCGYL